jgi:hypothetical protein
MRTSALVSAAAALLGACAHVDAPQTEVAVTAPPVEAIETAEPPVPPPQPQQPPAVTPAAVARIDNTSLASFRRSWQELYTGLSDAEQARLTSAAAKIAFAPYRGVSSVPLDLRYSPIVPEMIRDQIAGMTYGEIIELSRKSASAEASAP